MSSKFYIYGGGRWREIELDTGNVSGWGRPSFVYLHDGKLVMAKRRRVLRALRSLAAGRASAAKDSFELSEYEPPQVPSLKHRKKCHVHQQQTLIRSINDDDCTRCNDERFNNVLKVTSSVGTQCTSTVDASNQVSDTMISPQACSNNTNSLKTLPLRRKGKFIKSKSKNVNKCKQREDREPAQTVITKDHTKRLEKTDNLKNREELMQNTKKHRQEVKEILIEDDVVEILRRYLKKNNLGVDSERYDVDDAYKEHVFYKINPLVVVEQCPQIKRMLQGSRTDDVSEKDFMTSLGLQTNAERASAKRYRNQSTSCSSTQSLQDNNENELQNISFSLRKRTKRLKGSEFKRYKSCEKKDKQLSPQKMREAVLVSSNSDSDFQDSQLSRTLHVRPRVNGLRVTASPVNAAPGDSAVSVSRAARGYSPLEDQAIISWVQRDGRAHLVNGNRVWRQLQPHHAATTGVCEIKYRKQKKPANNSIFSMPRVRSAFAPRRARLASSLSPSPPPTHPPSPPRRAKAISSTTVSPPRKTRAISSTTTSPQRKARAITTTASPPRKTRSISSTTTSPQRKARAIATTASPPRKTRAITSTTASPQRKARAISTTAASPPYTGKRRAMANSTSTASSSPSPVPTGSSTPTQLQIQEVHTGPGKFILSSPTAKAILWTIMHVPRRRSRLSKRYSDLRRRFQDVEESSDEAPRVLRPRPSQAPRPSHAPRPSQAPRRSVMQDSGRALRLEPKKRRLYNPEVI
ncbi:hypothetical protein RR46_08011 [Papilio xuthus]|uniref:Uncharacterized protein n=1 Tax=Papilio xuthus TaxID=66420 RepID=A0A194Q9W8_PAPXU|nr:hypothetical protein RR46_08011 [Papilio xuthus]